MHAPGARAGGGVNTRRVWRSRCAPGRLIAPPVPGRRVGRVLRHICAYRDLIAYGSFRSVAIYQYIPTAKHGQALPTATHGHGRVAAGSGCLGARQAVGVLSGKARCSTEELML